jgi:hemerythrin-like domain-containing protein
MNHRINAGQSPAADQKDAIAILIKEHEEAIEYLSRLEHASEYIRTNGFSFEAFMQISKALRFIGIEIKHHNEKEEKYLFRLLDEHAKGYQQAMRDEHKELRRLYTKLSESVEDVEEGRIYANTVNELLETSGALIRHLRDHIAKENEVLFPLARRVLTKRELEQLGESFASECQ